MKVLIFRIISIILLLCCMIAIFKLSSEDAQKSSNTSTKVITKVAEIVYPEFESLDNEEKAVKIEGLQFTVRKLAHLSIFALLGVTSFLTAVSFIGLRIKKSLIFNLLFCLLYAISDEVHQLFISGRSCELRDIMIDFFGAVIGTGICILVLKAVKWIYKKAFFQGEKV
ncbi:MAG: VanZ family protein [Clostridia bacterium]|nr:VanZ family protein [Clostridia bacterium]